VKNFIFGQLTKKRVSEQLALIEVVFSNETKGEEK
jgi:hypothetical protein